MSRRRSRRSARLVQAGDRQFVRSRALALPRLSALSAINHEDDALAFVRHPDFVASAPHLRMPRLPPAKRVVVRGSRPWSALSMLSPRRVLFCLRRKIRKEVLFAINRSGRNGGRVYRRRQESSYAC